MLSRKPTAIRLTQEDLQDYDNLVAEQSPTPSEGSPNQAIHKTNKGKEVATTAQGRQATMDERIGVTNPGTGAGGR
jgi:Anaphase-promoting complex APC subunit CDC26